MEANYVFLASTPIIYELIAMESTNIKRSKKLIPGASSICTKIKILFIYSSVNKNLESLYYTSAQKQVFL
jgi:hypothetical protein